MWQTFVNFIAADPFVNTFRKIFPTRSVLLSEVRSQLSLSESLLYEQRHVIWGLPIRQTHKASVRQWIPWRSIVWEKATIKNSFKNNMLLIPCCLAALQHYSIILLLILLLILHCLNYFWKILKSWYPY